MEVLCHGLKERLSALGDGTWLVFPAFGLVMTILAEVYVLWRGRQFGAVCALMLAAAYASGVYAIVRVKFSDPGVRQRDPEAEETVVRCPLQHVLRERAGPTGEVLHWCSNCYRVHRRGATRWGCTGCDYELCDTCYGYASDCDICGCPSGGHPPAQHCRSCNHCVEGRIHHCGAIGVCVGEGNYRSFTALFVCLGAWGVILLVAAIPDIAELLEETGSLNDLLGDKQLMVAVMLVVTVAGIFSTCLGFGSAGLMLFKYFMVCVFGYNPPNFEVFLSPNYWWKRCCTRAGSERGTSRLDESVRIDKI